MRLIFFCGQPSGELTLKWLVENYITDIIAIVLPKTSKGLSKNIISKIPQVKFETNSQLNFFLKDLEPFDLGLLAWWPHLIPMSLLNLPKHGFINMHPSLLPYNRGRNPNFWALTDQTPFGVSILFADAGIDTGDIIAQSKIDYDWTDTGQTLYKKAQEEMLKLFAKFYTKIRKGKFKRKSQDRNEGSNHLFKELSSKSEIELDKKYYARDLLNLLRARTFYPYPGCKFVDNGKTYEIRISINETKNN